MNELRFFADLCVSNYIIQALGDKDRDVFKLKDNIPQNSPYERVDE